MIRTLHQSLKHTNGFEIDLPSFRFAQKGVSALLHCSRGFHVFLVELVHPMAYGSVEQDGSKCKCMCVHVLPLL